MTNRIPLSSLMKLRPGAESDEPFIYATWLNGLRHGNETFGFIDQDIYFENYHKVIEKILVMPNTRIQVACLFDDPDVILGYSVSHSDHLLHYVFVKKQWRKIGIADALMPPKLNVVTHITDVAKSLLIHNQKFNHVIFNPFLI